MGQYRAETKMEQKLEIPAPYTRYTADIPAANYTATRGKSSHTCAPPLWCTDPWHQDLRVVRKTTCNSQSKTPKGYIKSTCTVRPPVIKCKFQPDKVVLKDHSQLWNAHGQLNGNT